MKRFSYTDSCNCVTETSTEGEALKTPEMGIAILKVNGQLASSGAAKLLIALSSNSKNVLYRAASGYSSPSRKVLTQTRFLI